LAGNTCRLGNGVGGRRSDFPISRFQISAFAFAGKISQFQHFSVSAFALPLWSEDFTAKLFCNVEFWLERLPKLIGLCDGAGVMIPNSGPTISPGKKTNQTMG
jgi:hypothetical protein